MMILPTLHLNGSSRARLVADACVALAKLDESLEALCRARPHGRDYYPQGAAALGEASDQHERWITLVHTVQTELRAWTEKVNLAARS